MASKYSTPINSDDEDDRVRFSPRHSAAEILVGLSRSTAVGNSPRVDPQVPKSPSRHIGLGGGGALPGQAAPVSQGSAYAAISNMVARGSGSHATADRHITTVKVYDPPLNCRVTDMGHYLQKLLLTRSLISLGAIPSLLRNSVTSFWRKPTSV